MKKLKSIPSDKVEILVRGLEDRYKSIQDTANSLEGSPMQQAYSHSTALGMAESVIEHLIKQLKGEHPIV